MSVVNVSVKYIRPKYENLYEWMQDKNNVYIGRKGPVFINGKRYPQKDNLFANPYKVGKETRDLVLQKYRIYIENKIINKPNVKSELMKLKGKVLGCWCVPEKCHGHILLELIEKYDNLDNECNDKIDNKTVIKT